MSNNNILDFEMLYGSDVMILVIKYMTISVVVHDDAMYHGEVKVKLLDNSLLLNDIYFMIAIRVGLVEFLGHKNEMPQCG